MSFERDMNNAKKKIEDALEKAIRGASIEMFGEIVRRTPVGDPKLWKSQVRPKGYRAGTLRNSWSVSIGRPETRSTEEKPDKSGSKSLQQVQKADGFTLRDKAIYLTNNLPYSEAIENGHSTQRPNGMMKVTVKQFTPLIDKMARKYKV